MKRIHHLEGLRTIFCLVVVTHHILQAFYPEFPQILVNDGRIAVIYFLVLTGFTIPLQIFKTSKTASPSQIPKYALFRYLRCFHLFLSLSWLPTFCNNWGLFAHKTLQQNSVFTELRITIIHHVLFQWHCLTAS